MPVKRIKNKENLIGLTRINCKKKYYYDVYLWSSLDDLLNNVDFKDLPTEVWRKTRACCVFNPSYLIDGKEKIYPKLGEIHFLKDKWLMVDVGHELCHALMRVLYFFPMQKKRKCLSANEDIAYEFGDWVEKVYCWLWKVNPYNKKWKRIKED